MGFEKLFVVEQLYFKVLKIASKLVCKKNTELINMKQITKQFLLWVPIYVKIWLDSWQYEKISFPWSSMADYFWPSWA